MTPNPSDLLRWWELTFGLAVPTTAQAHPLWL